MGIRKLLLPAVVAMIFSFILLPTSTSAAEKTTYNAEEDVKFGDVNILINTDLGMIIETRKVEEDGVPIEGGYVETDYSQVFDKISAEPDKQNTRIFTHDIYDGNKKYIGTVGATVIDAYNQYDNRTSIKSINASVPSPFTSDFSFTSSRNEEWGCLNMHFNGMYAGTMRYQIYSNGAIVNH